MRTGRERREEALAEGLPLVSVVVLTYQDFRYLFDTLETVLAQDYPQMELLISDDGSDAFPERRLTDWLKAHSAKRIPVRVRRNPVNVGLVRHSNRAARETEGQFVKFLSPGDGFVSPESLSVLTAFARQEPEPMVASPALVCSGSFANVRYQFPSARRVGQLRRQSPRRLFSVLSSANIISAVGMLYRREFFEAGGFDPSYRNLDDWPTWLKRYRQDERIPCCPTPTVYYMLGGISSADGTAFDSALLREDLRRCLETEILPYRSRLSWWGRSVAQYQYGRLTGTRSAAGLLPEGYFRLKKAVKRLVVGSHGDCGETAEGKEE